MRQEDIADLASLHAARAAARHGQDRARRGRLSATPPMAAASSTRSRPGGWSPTAIAIRTSSRAIKTQAEQLDQIIFAGYTHEPAEEVASRDAEARAARPRPCLLLRQRLDQRGSGAEDGARLLAQYRRAAHAHRRDAARLSWRHDRGDVGRRARRLQRRLWSAAVRCDDGAVSAAQGTEQATLDALEAACRDEAGRLHCRAADPGRRRDADVSGMGAQGDEADLRARTASVHCRRSHDRLGPHRDVVRLRAGGCRRPISPATPRD